MTDNNTNTVRLLDRHGVLIRAGLSLSRAAREMRLRREVLKEHLDHFGTCEVLGVRAYYDREARK